MPRERHNDQEALVAAVRLTIRGSVQGVGFRPWVWRTARELGLVGSVRNEGGGVRVDVCGSPAALAELRARLVCPPLPGACVEAIDAQHLDVPAAAGFEILASAPHEAGVPVAVALAPDLPTCADCLEELADPSSRRHRYPFIACAHCGPRYSMARDLPYDRARTAMADFPLCAACASEYARPEDRRFHAEATACPDCGPSLLYVEPAGGVSARGTAALARAVSLLRGGGIVAVKGIGGFHLACDASDDAAVGRLRDRKRRGRKPFAVMVATESEAEDHVTLDAPARELLVSDARPIVLLRRRGDSLLAPSLAPDSPTLGLFIAYSPLHTLLVEDFGGPLVMTSANRAGEPMPHRLEDSAESLSTLADGVLAHDREIVAPCDDSVALPTRGAAIVFRRSRGHVPRPIRLARPVRRAVLGCGGQWNNTVCVASGDRAWVSAHVGDVESPASAARLEETAQRWLAWLGVEPEVIAHDLHPGYESTRFARSHWGTARRVGVQHHHAHLASVLGEHGVRGPALGLIWDGTGHGGDGGSWGGELLFGDAGSCERLATFRPIALAGGDRAIREPWRLALALLEDAFDGAAPLDDLELFRGVGSDACERLRSLLASDVPCPQAHGAGRYFDAIGALLLMRPTATFSGELALATNYLCTGAAGIAYDFELERGSTPWTIDFRAMAREVVGDLRAGCAPSAIADRFHATLVAAGDTVVREACRGLGGEPAVVLGGGCFQNAILVDGLQGRLGADFRVLRAAQLPPGDGGLALGQVLVADALVAADEGG